MFVFYIRERGGEREREGGGRDGEREGGRERERARRERGREEEREKGEGERDGGRERGGREGVTEGERGTEGEREMIYSFRSLPLMKGCRWMTYHLTEHTIITPMNKKTNKLTTMYLTREREHRHNVLFSVVV